MDEVIDGFRSSTRGWLRGTLAGWGTILLALGGLAGALLLEYGLYPLALTALALGLVLAKWIQFVAARFELTEERLIVRRGIFFKSIDEIELYRVKDVRLDFTLVNQWAGIGTLCVSSSDETTRGQVFRIPHIERARDRRETLRRLVDQARQKRRVREIDMVGEY